MHQLSKKTVSEVIEQLQCSTLREIERECDTHDMLPHTTAPTNVIGQRRTLATQYMNALNFQDPLDVRKFIRLAESLMLQALKEGHFFKTFPTWLKRDGYTYTNGRIVPLSNVATIDTLQQTVPFDAVHIQTQIERMNRATDADPELAIGTAKELIEACCKTILHERGIETTGKENMPDLVKAATKTLNLTPHEVDDAKKGAETIKRVLSSLVQVTQGVNELRGLYGTGHGRDGKARGLRPRHARLVVSSACTLVQFFFDTHLETRCEKAA